jgi:tellurite resistance protein TerC
MSWFWLGFFALVALLLFLDLGVIHRRAREMSLRAAVGWTLAWVALGLAFSGVVYVIYEYHLAGVTLRSASPNPDGANAAITYVSAYLLEQALSIDNIFVMSLVFKNFKTPAKYQHRVLFWGILGAIGFRVFMLGGGAWIATKFDWVFYIFGGYLAWQGIKLLKANDEEEDEDPTKGPVVRFVRRFVRVVDGDHGGKFSVRVDGRRALTTVALCLIMIELLDVVFAMDSIPAVLSVSQDRFIMITSNVFAILGLRSLYFVLAGAMAKFKYLKLALGVLLVAIGAKMIAHKWYYVPHTITLAVIAGIIAIGVLASVISTRRAAKSEPAQ